MAGAGNDTSDCESLKRLLNDTAAACQKCLIAVDSVASKRQAPVSTMQSTTSALTSVDIEAMEKLQHRCVELEHQLVTERSHKEDQLSDTQQLQIDDIIIKYKERIKTVEDDKMALEDENRRLHLINNQVTARNVSLTQQVEALTSQVDVLQRGMTASSNDDHVQFLMEQARQFRADFESEKHDRIAAEARISELQEQLAAANTQTHQTTLQRMQDIAQRREASLQYYREQYDSTQPREPSPSSSLSLRPVNSRYTDGEDEIDSVIVRGDHDDVESIQKHLTRANIAP